MLVTIFGCWWLFDIESISNPIGPVPIQFIIPKIKNRWFPIWLVLSAEVIMKINHQIFYQGSVNLHKVQFGSFGFSEDDWLSLAHPSKGVLRLNLPKSRKYWSADHHVIPYLGRWPRFCSGITQPWFLKIILPIEYGIWYCREIFSTSEHLWFVPSWFWSENWFLISNLHCILLWTHVELLFSNSNRYPKIDLVKPVWSGPPRTDFAGHCQNAIINDYAYSHHDGHHKCTRIQSKLPGIGNEFLNKGWKTRRKMEKSPEVQGLNSLKKSNF